MQQAQPLQPVAQAQPVAPQGKSKLPIVILVAVGALCLLSAAGASVVAVLLG